MKLTEENRSTRGKTCPTATLSTINLTWTDQGSNPGIRGERPATNRLSLGTAQFCDTALLYKYAQYSEKHYRLSQIFRQYIVPRKYDRQGEKHYHLCHSVLLYSIVVLLRYKSASSFPRVMSPSLEMCLLKAFVVFCMFGQYNVLFLRPRSRENICRNKKRNKRATTEKLTGDLSPPMATCVAASGNAIRCKQ